MILPYWITSADLYAHLSNREAEITYFLVAGSVKL